MPMDEYTRFCEAVLKHIPRATGQEKEELYGELWDHLESRQELLMEFGVSEEDARIRAVAAMGDAGEIGRQWNEQLSPFWLWLGRLCKAVCILLVLCMIWPFFIQIGNVYENLLARSNARTDPNLAAGEELWQQELDIREEFADHIIRIYRVAVLEHPEEPEMGRLRVYMISYARNPFRTAVSYGALTNHVFCNGNPCWNSGGEGRGGYTQCVVESEVEKGLEMAEITLGRFGQKLSIEIPLEWGGDGS